MMRQSGTYAGRLVGALMCAGVALLVGCILDLDPIPSCGDGYVDDAAGEQCDPADDDPTPCDPVDCRTQTVYCGNGVRDPGEACDFDDFGNKTCQSGKGFLSCNADCTLDETTCDPCGNGELDPGEECDPKHVPMEGGLVNPVECSSLTEFPLKPYTTGIVTMCTNECMWYRGPCGYCGDNEVDPPTIVDLNFPDGKSEDEFCDGDDAPLDRLRAYCDSTCPSIGLECKATCLNDCSAFDFKQISSEELQCCVAPGTRCPSEGDPAPCCFAYKEGLQDKFDSDAACFDQFDEMGVIRSVCR
jgi:hypothetical protein